MKESVFHIGDVLLQLVLFSSALVWCSIAAEPAVRCRLRPVRSRAAGTHEPLVVLVAFLIWIGTPAVVVDWLGRTEQPSLHNILVQNLSLGLVLIALWPLIVFAPVLSGEKRNRLSEFGIHLRGLHKEIGYGFVGFLAAVLPVYLFRWATKAILDLIGLPLEPRSMLKFLAHDDRGAVLLGIGVSVVVLAPLVEELLFRVVLQGWLETVLPAGLAIGLTAAVFALIHPFTDSPALLPLALILGCLYASRRSYPAVVVLHATFNGANLLLFLAAGRG